MTLRSFPRYHSFAYFDRKSKIEKWIVSLLFPTSLKMTWVYRSRYYSVRTITSIRILIYRIFHMRSIMISWCIRFIHTFFLIQILIPNMIYIIRSTDMIKKCKLMKNKILSFLRKNWTFLIRTSKNQDTGETILDHVFRNMRYGLPIPSDTERYHDETDCRKKELAVRCRIFLFHLCDHFSVMRQIVRKCLFVLTLAFDDHYYSEFNSSLSPRYRYFSDKCRDLK